MNNFFRIHIFSAIIICLISLPSYSQSNAILQFSGVVVDSDSSFGIPDVAVYVPRTGRGIFTNHKGYFSIPVLSGDTVKVKSAGFKERNIIMPDSGEKFSMVIKLELDTFMLPEIVLWPYPDFNDFKDAFLALETESAHQDYANQNLNERVLRRMLYNSDASGSENSRYFMYQQANRQQYGNALPYVSLFNPFAWAKFIKDIKSGGLKNKEWEEIDKMKHEEEEERY